MDGAKAYNFGYDQGYEQGKKDALNIPECDGCIWKGKRHQKCSCCRRNRYLKDCYEENK